MHWSRFSIRSVFVLTTVVAGGTAVALAAGPGPTFAYGLFVWIVAAHILAVRLGHAVSGHTVVRGDDALQGDRAANAVASCRYRIARRDGRSAARRVRQATVIGSALGSVLALLLIVVLLGAAHPVTFLATGCSGGVLGGLCTMAIFGVCDFFAGA